MKLEVLAVFDEASSTFGRPAFVASRGAGVRSFQDEVARDAPDNLLHSHPNDFALYQLGSWDDSTGLFDLAPRPELVVRASDVVRK